ncbi:MAG: hypothetical protein A2821_00130 [Candidatus Magasanikbacteria bacterium RIFCSPHIGHO2_01_FULL_41_23]|uniref:Cation-transporting P-type ATPase N-terminal domain-containing protein n=1 Tax=Candidatus Magasanikbacteria bacterium RIFCSPLOWO2_01_FULL_40_15 TaxID=1798686 RepID=A0A1F6N4J8_9BACT|nr:MAG: hypothetical protein A2821_00130 [Candidatus Magasanikbacteria bacterium RIFCSPHIGHO2_01_FULL_41_23]OGH76595.1 MAG: hypothetical protein A3F22_04640 [Candidatus Magasanikbacteria bacterium RIFCSPHIGHO2_12_FULL_41_16]OGH78573.1 MAG: hypothetical protein A2983_02840 [Candidatus Magasanikbacteria bacterium RIFCSPLOWO2_01_FULL_40_15]
MDFCTQSISEVLKEVQSSESGLTIEEAKQRIIHYGENRLPVDARLDSQLSIFLNQWKSSLIIVLVVAGIVSAWLADVVDALIIGLTVLVNVTVGFFQESKANQAVKKLARMVTFSARVMRSGKLVVIPSTEITLGDIIFLEAGDNVPADARIIEELELALNEAALTGESNSVLKNIRKLSANAPLANRSNMVFQGTQVVGGRGKAVVVAVGKNTEVGRISGLVEHTVESKTPLQIELVKLSAFIGRIVLVVVLIVFLIGFLRGNYSFLVLFQTAVSLAVAAIPEGLAITLTIILAIGMQFLLRRQALVRKMVAAETLGSVTVICTDKTGTLTEGKMSVSKLATVEKNFFRDDLSTLSVANSAHQTALLMLKAGVLCNNVRSLSQPMNGSYYEGDGTEIALVEAGALANIKKTVLDIALPRLSELPFDSRRKYMAVLNQGEVERLVYVKGALDVLRPHICAVEMNGSVKKITKKCLDYFEKVNADFSQNGLRILAICYRPAKSEEQKISADGIHDLVLVGLVGIVDPVRKTVKDTIIRAQAAGIRVIMITGDQAATARAIGIELGIAKPEDRVVNGEELNLFSSAELDNILKTVSIFSRVNPEDKIKIVTALKAQGEVVAMTGDGVNDSPALKGADIGVAMGGGTDIAREIADLVLLDNRFETIIMAVEEGRAMYANIQKVVIFLLAFSLCEVSLILISMLVGLPLALLPAQILWLNLVQDSLPSIALAFDRPDPQIMNRPPRGHGSALIGKIELQFMIGVMGVTAGLLVGLYFLARALIADEMGARSLVFAGFGLALLPAIYSVRLLGKPFFWRSLTNNFFLNCAVLFSFGLMLASVYLPGLQKILGTVALSGLELMIVAGFCVITFICIELVKGFIFKPYYDLS